MPSKKQSRNGHAFHPIMRKGGEWLDRSSFMKAA